MRHYLPLCLFVSVIGLYSPRAEAVATIASHSCTQQADNSMRYDCAVTLSGGLGTVRVGFRKFPIGNYKWSKLKTGSTFTFTLYNFEPDHTYYYKVDLVSEGTSATGTFTGTPELPDGLAQLNLTVSRDVAARTKYVLFDTYDCTNTDSYLVVYDTVNQWIAWYQDIAAETGLPSTSKPEWSYTRDDTILAVINKSQVFEWAWDGSEVGTTGAYTYCDPTSGGYGPCPHHDAARSDSGDTLVITGSGDTTYQPSDTVDFASICTSPSILGFVDDGVESYDSAWSLNTAWSLRTDFLYDPTPSGASGPGASVTCTGPYWTDNWGTSGFIDWTHVNSIFAQQVGSVETVTLSSKVLSEVFRYLPSTGVVRWTLNGLESTTRGDLVLSIDSGVYGYADFGGQHHVTMESGQLQMFDNRENADGGTGARGIRLEITPGSPGTAVITQSFVMRERGSPWSSLDCEHGLGSAVGVPNFEETNMLLNCGPSAVIEEIDEADGYQTRDPLLYLALDHAAPFDTCSGALTDSAQQLTFYRAWPIVRVGDFQ